MTFSERLKNVRASKKFTQKQVYEAIGMSAIGYQRYEYGDREPSYQNLLALADFFDVPIDFLAGRGLFKNWEQIMEHRDAITGYINEALQGKFDFSNYTEHQLMYVLPAIVKEIEFQDDEIKIIFL